MKKIRFLAIAAALAAIGFFMAGCNSGNNPAPTCGCRCRTETYCCIIDYGNCDCSAGETYCD